MIDLGPSDGDARLSRPRRRERDGFGFGEDSPVKHRLVAHLAGAQVGKASVTANGKRGAIFDLTASDGSGVELFQGDLFEPQFSEATARLVCRLAKRCDADAWLCELKDDRRAKLTVACPTGVVVKDHGRLKRLIPLGHYDWGLAISDPCGPSAHGEDVLLELARRIRRLDVIVTQNLSAIVRAVAVTGERDGGGTMRAQIDGLVATRVRYGAMADPLWWGRLLGKRHVLRSRVEVCNRAFRGPVLLLTDSPANVSTRLFERLA